MWWDVNIEQKIERGERIGHFTPAITTGSPSDMQWRAWFTVRSPVPFNCLSVIGFFHSMGEVVAPSHAMNSNCGYSLYYSSLQYLKLICWLNSSEYVHIWLMRRVSLLKNSTANEAPLTWWQTFHFLWLLHNKSTQWVRQWNTFNVKQQQ